MRAKRLNIIILAIVFTQIAAAASVRDVVRQGNKLYDKGNFNDALKEYDEALIDRPQALEPKFNKANCYVQLDDLAKAIDLYNEVAADAKDMKLVEKAKYNLGDSYFRQGIKQKDSDLQKAMEDLQKSIICWRGALEINPENEKAAKNIEVARLTIKDIIDQINKQKEKQQQQTEKQKQLADQLKELAEQQKALAQKNQQTKNDADKGQISQQQAQEDYQKQADEQSQLQDKTEQTAQQMQQQQDPNNPQPQQMQQAGAELKQATDAQSDAQTQLQASKSDAAKKSQDKAAKHLENALKELSQGDQQQQAQQQEQQGQQQPGEPNQPSQEQQQQQQEQKAAAASDATAQEILDKEQQEKKQRQILQQGGYQKVEKDW